MESQGTTIIGKCQMCSPAAFMTLPFTCWMPMYLYMENWSKVKVTPHVHKIKIILINLLINCQSFSCHTYSGVLICMILIPPSRMG